MERLFLCFLLLLSLYEASGKYVLVDKWWTWHQAQNYCREFHTELAPVSTAHDIQLVTHVPGYDFHSRYWIGLRKDTDSGKWMWSGAGEAKTFFWGNGEPDNRVNEDYVTIHKDTWHNEYNKGYSFLCYKVNVVRERKTWLEALEYCRRNHSDLASVASEAEMTIIWRELEKKRDHGARLDRASLFSGLWLWTDGQQTDYEAWGGDRKPECPRVEMECAALKMREETQGGNSTNSTLSGIFQYPENQSVDVQGFSEAGVRDQTWEARDCEEKHYFVCY